MKLLAMFILHKEGDRKTKILQDEFNLDSFGYFQRNGVKQLLIFSARTVTERTAAGTRQSVEAENVDAMVHVYVRSDGLSSVIISDSEYPMRVAHTLLTKAPSQADPLMRLQNDLDDTKNILKNTLVNVLERGEKIDDLVVRSCDLYFA
ncbi:unnamed protein product [Didymodactylos carnosus]|uniref:Uncharacterized protein n=1 Tax=Didymodactylos carnosus TaxID=1234261 RepID=A0A8S2J3D0_9BILA|nr:unnamed protein product [Didymodactylos carnosus]CAF3778208.1 unnamed protein product [Didymodactylos carnosus]